MEKVKINPSTVKKQIEELGFTRVKLAEHYGISTAQINKFLKLTKLDTLKATKVAFEIEFDEPQIENINKQTVEASNNQEEVNSNNNTNFLYQ